MSSAEKELGERLAEVGKSLLAPPSDVDELLSLLDKAEFLLSRVEQSPSQSMSSALHPAMNGLVAKELFGHLDEDVKVAVASCISEITRITAPDAPYNDDLMKDIFQKIVDAFEKLDDMSSRSQSKRVSILETVAKVRSCVVMLDLECDALILEMFHHFLRTIRDNHPPNVFSSMEVIMTLVVEESEDISPKLVSTLLMHVKKGAKDILPVARRLAEKVIGKCAIKLKPCLMEVVQSAGGRLSDYRKIITTVCKESSDVLENNGLNASGECVVDDSKFSERTVSDELAQGSGKIESEVSCPEIGTASGRSPKSVMSNGVVLAGNEALAELTSTNKKSDLPKNASASRTEEDKSDLIDVKGTSSEHGNKKSKGHKSNSVLRLANMNDSSQIVDEKGDVDLPNKKAHDKGSDSSQSECPPSKEMEPTLQKEHKKGVEPEVSEKFNKDQDSVVSPSSNEKLHDTSRPKRGRRLGVIVEKGGAGDAHVSSSSLHKPKAIEDTDTEALLGSKKQKEVSKDSDRKPGRRSGKKQSAGSVEDSGKSSSHRKMEVDVGSDEEEKLLTKRRKLHMVSDGDTSGRRQRTKSKLLRSRYLSDNEMVSTPKMAAKGDKGQVILEESKSWKKRSREEISETPGDTLKYDESLIGANIEVWWPDDKKFYRGTVDSYNPTTKKHLVLYSDGDQEVLLLKNERFKFIGDGEGEEKGNLSPEAASETSRRKAKKSTVSSASRSESEGMHGDDGTKSAGGVRRGRKPKLVDNDSMPSGSKSKEKTNGKPGVHTPKLGSISKNELNKATDGMSESGSKSKPGRKPKAAPITGSRSKADASGSKDVEARSGNKKPGRKSKEDKTPRSVQKLKSVATNLESGSKVDDDGDKSGMSKGEDAQDVEARSGNKSSDTHKRGRKSKEGKTPKSVQKLKSAATNSESGSKVDGVEDKSGTSKGEEAEDGASRKSGEVEGRRKRQPKKTQD